jgi:hypothetical protein
MGAAFKRQGAPQVERSPASGVRPRVLPQEDRAEEDRAEEDRAEEDRAEELRFEAAPFSVIPPANTQDERASHLPLEEAVPFHGNTAIAAVFLFVTSAAAAMVAVGLYL